MRDLYKSFLKEGILPSEVDKQDIDVLFWIILSDNKRQDGQAGSGAIMGLM